MTLDDVEEVLDGLPDRDLVPEEVDAVGAALDADIVSSATYSDDSGETAVLMVFLWWERDAESGLGVAGVLDRDPSGEWSLDALGTTTSAGFLDAVDAAAEDLGAERRGGDRLVDVDPETGEVRDSVERDLS